MRIISDFKDYYDCMARYDDDRVTMFVRKREKAAPIEEMVEFPHGGGWYDELDYETVVIAFCGVFYPILDVRRSQRQNKAVMVYDKTMATNMFKKSIWSRGRVASLFDYFANNERPELKAMVEKYGPVFALSTYNIGWDISDKDAWNRPGRDMVFVQRNICLKPFGFYKILPPPLAYNELWKFVCNMQRPAMPIPEMSNDVKIHQAGFNLKTSFRKPKSKK